jgi:hypothetical protein
MCGQIFSDTICLSSLSANSGSASSNAIRVPRSGFANSFTTGSSTRLRYSSEETYVPSWITSGMRDGADMDIVECVREVKRAGRMRCVENVGGRVGAASLIVLHIKWSSQPDHFEMQHVTYRSNAALSPSAIKPKLSNPSHILNSLFPLKNPPLSPRLSAKPTSSSALGVIRPLGFGLSSFLNEGHNEGGIAPRAEGCGGLYGGSRNGG